MDYQENPGGIFELLAEKRLLLLWNACATGWPEKFSICRQEIHNLVNQVVFPVLTGCQDIKESQNWVRKGN